jgi:N-acetylglucosaminyl-diphospho-decaprenol L-rhamnosyltransferase
VSPSASEPAASGSQSRIDLSIIVVSYNTSDLLLRCLDSVAASLDATPALRAETIVVDNASADGSVESEAQHCPWARVMPRNTNSGFAAASNEGIAASTGRIVLLLNPDTEVLGSALAEIVDCFDRHPDAGIVGGHLLNPDGSEQESCFRFPGLAQQFLDFFPINHRVTASRLNGRYSVREADREHQVDHPLGACFAISREVIDAIGPLDAAFFMYCEEVDWALRTRKAGWEAWYAPRAHVIHHGGAAARQVRGRMLVELYRSRFRFWRKHRGTTFVWAARRIVHVGLAAQARRWRIEHLRGEISDERLAELESAARAVWAL